MSEYLLFLDETNKTVHSPYFCLAGFAIDRQEYENVLIPQINSSKNILGDPHIVFHYTEMKKSDGKFIMLKDVPTRNKFWNEIKRILSSTTLYTMGAYLDKKFYDDNFPRSNCKDSYLIAMQRIVSNYIHFLNKENSTGSIICESRNLKDDARAQESYFEIIKNGTDIFNSETVKKRLTTLSFNIKKDNCVGLQVADIIPITFMRNLQGHTDTYNLHQPLSLKLYDGGVGNKDVFGLTKIL